MSALAVVLPDPSTEFRAVPPDGASLDGLLPTHRLPLDSARTPDPEPGATVSGFEEFPSVAESALAGPVMHISERGLALIEAFEGFSATKYLDSVGVPTIGYGTTAADISPLPDTCTRAQAEGWLREKMAAKYEPAVRSLGVPLNQHEFDALCSFVYNLGPGSMAPSWTIGRLLRAKQYAQAADALLMYDVAGGVVLQGLLNRRRAERALFLEPVKPSDPHQYLWSPNVVYEIEGHHVRERATRRKFAQAVAAHKHDEARRQQELIVLLRQRVWFVAHHDPTLKHTVTPARWPDEHLGWRWQELHKLSVEHV